MTEEGAGIREPGPRRNDGVTTTGPSCPVCGRLFQPRGRRRFCSDACRQAAWRGRHPAPRELISLQSGEGRPARSSTIYECPSCGVRYLGERRCPDCQLFCRRVGPGGLCPHCGDPVALSDLLDVQGR